MKKTSLILGCTGQDGSLLAQYLLKRGDYKVIGMQRRTSSPTDWRLHELNLYSNPNFITVSGDLTDQGSLDRIMLEYNPDEVYNLAAMSFVGASWQMPIATMDITGLGAVRVLEAVRKMKNPAKVYQASSSEMFGLSQKGEMLNEMSHFHPRSPYGVAKTTAHYATINYRESFGLRTYCGILFNHESEYRGIEFVTRKITDGIARIYLGIAGHIELLNIFSARDWGYADDFVRAMWMMMQGEPDDYVIATGRTRSIKEFLDVAFRCAGITDWSPYVKIADKGQRPAEVPYLLGDATKAKDKLGWEPEVSFEEMVLLMVEKDIERRRNQNGKSY